MRLIAIHDIEGRISTLFTQPPDAPPGYVEVQGEQLKTELAGTELNFDLQDLQLPDGLAEFVQKVLVKTGAHRMAISRRLLALIGRRYPAVYDVIPHGPLLGLSGGTAGQRSHSTRSRCRRVSWGRPWLRSLCGQSGSPTVSASIKGSRLTNSRIGARPYPEGRNCRRGGHPFPNRTRPRTGSLISTLALLLGLQRPPPNWRVRKSASW